MCCYVLFVYMADMRFLQKIIYKGFFLVQSKKMCTQECTPIGVQKKICIAWVYFWVQIFDSVQQSYVAFYYDVKGLIFVCEFCIQYIVFAVHLGQKIICSIFWFKLWKMEYCLKQLCNQSITKIDIKSRNNIKSFRKKGTKIGSTSPLERLENGTVHN